MIWLSEKVALIRSPRFYASLCPYFLWAQTNLNVVRPASLLLVLSPFARLGIPSEFRRETKSTGKTAVEMGLLRMSATGVGKKARENAIYSMKKTTLICRQKTT